MKKERVLKYLILICSMMVSFFIFASGGVNALEEYSVNDGKIILELEKVDDADASKGYIISGAQLGAGVTSINGWVIPDTYDVDGNPIVGIKGSDGNNQFGVLNALANAVSGNVVLGKNIENIGFCAFCSFTNVTQYELNENLSVVDEYAFAYNDSLENVVVKAYNDTKTNLANSNVFNSSFNLRRVVLKNSTILDHYKGMDVWKTLDADFTYKIQYHFYNEEGTSFTPVDYYFFETLGSVPADIVKTGLKFSWKAKIKGNTVVVDANSRAQDNGQTDANLNPILEVRPEWVLKGANELYIKTSVGGNSVDHKGDNKSIETTYAGKNDKLTIQAVLKHDFMDANDEKLSLEYSWVKNDGWISSPVVGNDIISVYQTGESGTYICTITIRYPDYTSVTETVQINVSIKKKDVTVTVKGQEVEYGTYLTKVENAPDTYYIIDKETPLAQGETIKVFDFAGYCKDVGDGQCEKSSVGTIPMALDGEVVNVGYSGDDTNYAEHYNFKIEKGDLTVKPRIISHTLEQNIEIEYGSSTDLIEMKTVNIYGEDIIVKIRYIREDSSNLDADEYDVLSANVIKGDVIDGNYRIQLAATNPGKVIIKPKPVNVEWVKDDNLVYDGNEKVVSASYKDISNVTKKLFVSIVKDGKTSVIKDAGFYDLTASMLIEDKNYTLVGATYDDLEVKKAESDLDGPEVQTVTYNGKPQRVNLTLNHSGDIIWGNYDHCKDANESTGAYCKMTVTVPETPNYTGIKEKEYLLRILRVRKEVEPKVFQHTYGTSFSSSTLCSLYPGAENEEIQICFSMKNAGSGSTILPVGFYDIQTAYTNESMNYDVRLKEGSGVNKIEILKAPVKIRFYFYEGLVYDGTVKNVTARWEGTTEDVGLKLTYADNKTTIMNAGNYRIDASISNSNYYIDGDSYVEFSVAKAKYDVSHLKLESKKVSFNFGSHFINLVGDLPEGLTAKYTIDGEKGNGTYLPFKHTVKVTFAGDYDNYEYVDPMTATLNVKMTWVWVTLGLVAFFGGVIPTAVYLLMFKYKIIKIEVIRKALTRKTVSRARIRKMIRKNRELDRLNQMLRDKQAAWYASQEDKEEEVEIIEEPIKFVKNPINTKPESLIEMSFVDELFKSSYGTKQIYSEIKNELLSYEGVVSKIKRDFETFYLNNIPIAKLDVVKGTLYAYFALDPSQYKKEEYKHTDVSKEKDFATVPLKLTVKTLEALRHAKMFVRIIRKREGIKAVSNFIRTDYVSVYTAKENTFSLFKKAFVKKGTKEYEED